MVWIGGGGNVGGPSQLWESWSYTRDLDLIKGINPVYSKHNEGSGVKGESGFVRLLAQDLQAVAPDMVNDIPHPGEEDENTDYLSVDAQRVVYESK